MMHIKYTMVGMLIYATILLWLLSTLPRSTGVRWRRVCFFLGGVLMLAAFGFRWIETGHVPLQNLFDVFLALGVSVVPLWWFCERYLGAGALMSHAAAATAGVCVLIPAGLVFSADPQPLPPALQSPLFVPHVGAYMLAYMMLFLAGLTAARQLFTGGERAERLEQLSSRLVRLGFPLLTLGLVLGAAWGKLCWGDYWNWDPKELWSLATWLTFAAYLHWRSWHGGRFAKTNGVLVLLGVACVILTLLWVNLSRLFPGMHAYA